MSSERLNCILSAAQFNSCLPKNRAEYTIPLYTTPPTLTDAQCTAIGQVFIALLKADDLPETDEELRALIRAAAAGGA